MITPDASLLERQLLLHLGDRLKRLRKAQHLGTVEMAQRVGISRTTLAAVEAGDPATSIGIYLRVMAALGIVGDMALLAGDVLQAAPSDSAGARSRRGRPGVEVRISADSSRHQTQDLQSLALHEEALRLIKADPSLLRGVEETLDRWLQSGPSRTAPLWREWKDILARRAWRRVLSRSPRCQALRQASPLVTVVPEDSRRRILASVESLRKGVVIGDNLEEALP